MTSEDRAEGHADAGEYRDGPWGRSMAPGSWLVPHVGQAGSRPCPCEASPSAHIPAGPVGTWKHRVAPAGHKALTSDKCV